MGEATVLSSCVEESCMFHCAGDKCSEKEIMLDEDGNCATYVEVSRESADG